MPLVPAAKGIIILTPIILAAGYAIYDTHSPFRNFVDEQWRRLQDFAEEQGWREREQEPMSFGGSGLWDPAEGFGLRERQPDNSARQRARRRRSSSSAESTSRRDEMELGHTTAAVSGTAAHGLDKRQPRSYDDEDLAKPSQPLSKASLQSLESAATGATASGLPKSEVDTASECSRHGTDAVLTPTTEEGESLFGDGTGTHNELDDARSDTTETATDADMLSSVNSSTADYELAGSRDILSESRGDVRSPRDDLAFSRDDLAVSGNSLPHPQDELSNSRGNLSDTRDDDDNVSVASSWSEIGSEVSFASSL